MDNQYLFLLIAMLAIAAVVVGRYLGGRPVRPNSGKAWYSEFAICPMCEGFVHPRYHSPLYGPGEPVYHCSAPTAGTHHNHCRCQCGYEWTLPPRHPEVINKPVPTRPDPGRRST
jgi:hypothetical protein